MDDVRRAEETLVGTVVLEPRRLDEVAGWLQPADFGSPACRLLYQRLLDVRHRGDEPGGTRLLEQLRERGELRSDGYPISALTRWFDAVPARPHAAAYGALVLEGALGRQVEAAGLRLVQASNRLGPAHALVAAVTQRTVLAAAQRRWCSVPRVVRTTGPTELVAVRGGQAVGPVSRRRRDEGVEHAELVTLGSVLVAPHVAGRVRWLEQADFASPDIARAFSTVRAMATAGVAVDSVTVASELHRCGARPARTEWSKLLARAEASVPIPGSVGFYGRQVLDASVVGQVDAAGRRLLELGRSRPGGAAVMLEAALGDLDGLRAVHQRLRRSRQLTAVRPLRTAERTAAARVAAPHVLDRTTG